MGSRHLKRLALDNSIQAQSSSDQEEEEGQEESPVQQKKNPFAFLEAEEGSEREEEDELETPVQQIVAPNSTQQMGKATRVASKPAQKDEKRKKKGAKKEKEEDLDELLESMNISLVCSFGMGVPLPRQQGPRRVHIIQPSTPKFLTQSLLLRSITLSTQPL